MSPWAVLFVIAALGLLCLAAVASGAGASAGGESFQPTFLACTDDASTIDIEPFTPGDAGECDGPNAPGVPAAVTTTFAIEPPQSHPGQHVNFVPPEWGIARDADVPDGTLVGRSVRTEGIGFLSGNCANVVSFAFDLRDATTDMSATVPIADQFDVEGGLERGVIDYPDYLARILVDSADAPIRPIARYFGSVDESGVKFSLNIAVMEPGADIFGLNPASGLGYPVVAVFGDDGDPSIAPTVNPKPFFLSNLCSPFRLQHTALSNVFTNPATDGAYTFVAYARTRPDADGDGHENPLDPCPFTPNPDWDPRSVDYVGDADRDFLPDECDPEPADDASPGGGRHDNDGDGYNNAQDNCPFVDNSAGLPLLWASGDDNQADTDGDGIGDSCDPNPDTVDGESEVVCTGSVVQIGSGGAMSPATSGLSGAGALAPCGDVVFATATPGASPTPTPVGELLTWGDHDCSGVADPVDALLTLRFDGGLAVNTGECPDFGTQITVSGASRHWGDVDCDGEITAIDSLKLLRDDAGLDVAVAAGCPELGELVTVYI